MTAILAATITSEAIEADIHAKGFSYCTSHVSDPLPAAVGLTVPETIVRERLIKRAVELVEDRESRVPDRKLGALTTERCYQVGLSMNIRRRPERGAVWRIAPPLTVSQAALPRGVEILDQALRESLDAMAGGQG